MPFRALLIAVYVILGIFLYACAWRNDRERHLNVGFHSVAGAAAGRRSRRRQQRHPCIDWLGNRRPVQMFVPLWAVALCNG